jgi:type II secretory pathway pseudopilin PulG
MQNPPAKPAAFTLPALLAALTAIGLVGAFLVPHLLGKHRTSLEAAAVQALGDILKAELAHRADGKGFAQDLATLHDRGLLSGPLAVGLKDGTRFGAIARDENGAPFDPARRFAYYATPEVYGQTGKRFLILDETGRIYARDPGFNAQPPAAWPASDPTTRGWIILGQ